MSERMTDEERSKIEEFVEVGHTLSEDQASALLVEVDRARASEAEKDAEIAKKDAQIKALADALESGRYALLSKAQIIGAPPGIMCWCRSGVSQHSRSCVDATKALEAMTAALRLAGRLP